MIGLGIAFLVALAVMAAGSGSAKKPIPPPGMPPVVPGPPDASKEQVQTKGKSGTVWITQQAGQNSNGDIFVDVFLPDGQMGSHPTMRVLRYAQPAAAGATRSFMEAAPGVDPHVLDVAMSDFNLIGAAKGPIDVGSMSPELQKELADALAALTVGVDGKIVGPVTPEAIQLATSVAGDLERAGFGSAATALREFIKAASTLVPSPPPNKQVPLPPHMPADMQDMINRALQLERDPAKLIAILNGLKAFQPQSPDILNAIDLLQALIVQVQAQQSAKDALGEIQKIVTPPDATIAPSIPASRTYTIRAGDTGESIALAYTGNKGRWTELVTANPSTKDAKYGFKANVNQVVNLPASWPSVPINPSGAQQQVVAPMPSGGSGRTYTVRAGDTGSSIAKYYTGNANRWTELVTANPETKDAQYGLKANPGKVLKIPASWPDPTGASPAPQPQQVSSPLPENPTYVPSIPVPAAPPMPKSPTELAADAMVRNLKAVQQSYPFPTAHGKEDQSLVKRFQGLANTTADGMAGPGTLVLAAVNGQSDLPLVPYWPKSATATNVLKYRADIQQVAARARAAGDLSGAAMLEASAARERGQGGIVGTMPA